MAKYEASKIAAEWWANQLDGSAKQDDGERGISHSLLVISAMENAVSPAKQAEYEDVLEGLIDDALDTFGFCRLRVTYEAKDELQIAARLTGVPYEAGSSFPAYNDMLVTKDKILHKEGYNAYQEPYNDKTKCLWEKGKTQDRGRNSDGGRV